jgi:hypothetical protein
MVTTKSRKPAKKVKSLPAKSVSARQARGVKGGDKAKGDGKVQTHDLSITKFLDK